MPLPKLLENTVYNNLHLKYFKVLDSDFSKNSIYKWPIHICTGVTSCGWNMAFYGKCSIFGQWCYWLTNPRVTDKTVTTKNWIVVDRYLQSLLLSCIKVIYISVPYIKYLLSSKNGGSLSATNLVTIPKECKTQVNRKQLLIQCSCHVIICAYNRYLYKISTS